jgi:hypothetical protein
MAFAGGPANRRFVQHDCAGRDKIAQAQKVKLVAGAPPP